MGGDIPKMRSSTRLPTYPSPLFWKSFHPKAIPYTFSILLYLGNFDINYGICRIVIISNNKKQNFVKINKYFGGYSRFFLT
jgi:hypothetical protein